MRRLVAFIAVLLLAACTRNLAGGGAGGRNPWTIPGVLRIGEQQEPDSLNLMFGNNASSDAVNVLLYSPLLRLDANGTLMPDLATQVPTLANGGISKDQRTITIHLRKGVVWSDGAPLTAADWLFTYHAVFNPRNNVKSRYGWDDIASASAQDPYTIVIHLKKTSVAALDVLTMGGSAYPPLPAHLLAKLPDINTASINSHPISSGPYLLKSWQHESQLIFVPNPHYWRGAPKLQELVWKIVPDTNTLLSELRTHEIDLYPNVDENSIAELSKIPGIRVVHRLVANWRHLDMNCSRPLLADVRVRRAIAAGVDWKHLVDTVYHGYDQLAVSDIFPQSWAAPSLMPYSYDPARARALLAQAGWRSGPDGILTKNGRRLRLELSATISAKSNEQAEVVIQSALKAIGIGVEIHNYPSSYFFAENGPLYTGKYDLEYSIDTNGADPDNSGWWNASFIPPHGADTTWTDDPIVNQTSGAAASTFDQAARKALYQREERRLREIDPTIFIYWETAYYGINTDVRHFVPAAYLADTWNAWQWQI
jgi:peptide/nickel transport system substrate-binding protein